MKGKSSFPTLAIVCGWSSSMWYAYLLWAGLCGTWFPCSRTFELDRLALGELKQIKPAAGQLYLVGTFPWKICTTWMIVIRKLYGCFWSKSNCLTVHAVLGLSYWLYPLFQDIIHKMFIARIKTERYLMRYLRK